MDVVTLRLDPASSLSLEQLAALFTDAYEGYPVPMACAASGSRCSRRTPRRTLLALNLPTDDSCAAALERLGGRRDVRQYELALGL